MHILQLNFERGWRGGERQTLLCMQQFQKAGHDVSLLARKDGALAKAAKRAGFAVYEYKNSIGLCLFLLRCGRGFDVLHAQTANTVTWLVLLKTWLRRPIVFTRRTAFKITEKKAKRTLWKWRKVDSLIAISDASAAEPRRFGLPVTVIPSAIAAQPLNSQHAQHFSAQFGLQGKKVLATAAALTHEKDPCTLVRAIACVKRVRDDFVFLHLGAGGDTEQAARSLVADLQLDSHYIFAGFHKNIEDLYPLMDVFVLSSREEALGTSVLDAFLYSVPVVSTDAGGLAEALADGRGLLCSVGDYQALADAIVRVLDDSDLRATMVKTARDYVLDEHDVVKMGTRYLVEYESVTKA